MLWGRWKESKQRRMYVVCVTHSLTPGLYPVLCEEVRDHFTFYNFNKFNFFLYLFLLYLPRVLFKKYM